MRRDRLLPRRAEGQRRSSQRRRDHRGGCCPRNQQWGGSGDRAGPGGKSTGDSNSPEHPHLQTDSTYIYKLNTKKAKADQVVANGVTIESGALFNLAP